MACVSDMRAGPERFVGTGILRRSVLKLVAAIADVSIRLLPEAIPSLAGGKEQHAQEAYKSLFHSRMSIQLYRTYRRRGILSFY